MAEFDADRTWPDRGRFVPDRALNVVALDLGLGEAVLRYAAREVLERDARWLAARYLHLLGKP